MKRTRIYSFLNLLILGVLVMSLHRQNKTIHDLEFTQKALLKNKGYPTSESDILVGKFYWCDSTIEDQWPDHTNHFVVLQEMRINGESWQMVQGQKKLYQMSKWLAPQVIYYCSENTNQALLFPMGQSPPKQGKVVVPEIHKVDPAPQKTNDVGKSKHMIA